MFLVLKASVAFDSNFGRNDECSVSGLLLFGRGEQEGEGLAVC